MKYLIFISILLISNLSYSQISSDSTQYSIIGFAYSKSAMQSESVKVIRDLIQKGNFDSIRSLLNSTNPSLKYLAIKVCEFEAKKSKIELSKVDRALIESAKQSDEKIEYRSGCTIRKIYTLKELFNDPNIEVNNRIKHWVRRIEKIRKDT